jgi:tRNA A37 threonylcarbamoyladenosine dehydratase
MDSHVMVIGLGGVGSWAAESLARSGIGKLSLVDFDQVCITNTNRQLQALGGAVGEYKASVLAERLRKISPQLKVIEHVKFYSMKTADELLGEKSEHGIPDFVVDAIDNVTAKCHLIHRCTERKIGLVSSTGSGGRLDPTQIKIDDLSVTENDPLARSIRKILRQQYGFPSRGKFGVTAVYSPEEARDPIELHYDGGKGFHCVCPQGQNDLHSCDARNLIMGNASFVTGAFGLACASVVVRSLIREE